MIRYDFDVAGREIWIFRAWHTRSHSTRNLDHIFTPQAVRLFCKFRVFLRTKNNLGQTFAITQIDENDAAMIARDMHPAGERNLPADVTFPKRIAIVRAIHAQAESGTLKNFATLSSNALLGMSDSSRVVRFFTLTCGHSSP